MKIIFKGNYINHYNATIFERHIFYECGGFVKKAVFTYMANEDGTYSKMMKTMIFVVDRVENVNDDWLNRYILLGLSW